MSDGSKKEIQALWFEADKLPEVFFVDQRKIPFKFEIISSKTPKQTADFIKNMVIRGAPSIGAAGAYGILQSAIIKRSLDKIEKDAQILLQARPTAVDLKNCINYMLKRARETNVDIPKLITSATSIVKDIIDECKKLAQTGFNLIKKYDTIRILTHCHTGSLATVDVGTALSIPIFAHQQGLDLEVFVAETRPRLQGGRLTAWELTQLGIKHRLIADSVSASLMEKGMDIVLVGADRIALNGDFANKIGTYSLAILANFHQIPFYSVAPWSTFDKNIQTGKEIPIEERSPDEVHKAWSEGLQYHQITNESPVYNPAFDITPNSLLTGIIAPGVVLKQPLKESIRKYLREQSS
jgi:methylthioribose-1-phosphate isomerase